MFDSLKRNLQFSEIAKSRSSLSGHAGCPGSLLFIFSTRVNFSPAVLNHALLDFNNVSTDL